MNGHADGLAERELSLIRLYMDLTGASESSARSVFMSVCCQEGEADDRGASIARQEEPGTDDALACGGKGVTG
jgi:hypothetical protein